MVLYLSFLICYLKGQEEDEEDDEPELEVQPTSRSDSDQMPVTPRKRKCPMSEKGFDDSDGSPSLKRNTQPSTSGISQL